MGSAGGGVFGEGGSAGGEAFGDGGTAGGRPPVEAGVAGGAVEGGVLVEGEAVAREGGEGGRVTGDEMGVSSFLETRSVRHFSFFSIGDNGELFNWVSSMTARVVFGLEAILLWVVALSVMVESKFAPFADI